MRLTTKPEFRIKLNGIYIPNIRVQKALDGGYDLAVRFDIGMDHGKEIDLGWFVVPVRPDLVLEYRDETSWALLPAEVRQTSTDKVWNACTPHELIGVLWNAGILT